MSFNLTADKFKSKSAHEGDSSSSEFSLPQIDLSLTPEQAESNAMFDFGLNMTDSFLQGAASQQSITMEQKAALGILETLINHMATQAATSPAVDSTAAAGASTLSSLSSTLGT